MGRGTRLLVVSAALAWAGMEAGALAGQRPAAAGALLAGGLAWIAGWFSDRPTGWWLFALTAAFAGLGAAVSVERRAVPGHGEVVRGRLLTIERGLVSCPRSSLHNSPALAGPGCVGPPRNTPGMPSSARLARTADGSPTYATNFSDRTLERTRLRVRLDGGSRVTLFLPHTGVPWLDRWPARLREGAMIRLRTRRGRPSWGLSPSAVEVLSPSTPSWLLRSLPQRVRRLFLARARRRLMPRGGAGEDGLLYALITGDRRELSFAQTRWLRASGLAHLAVVSGLHVGLAMIGLGRLLVLFWGARRRARAVVLVGATVLLVLLLPATAPVMRAGLVLFAGLLGELIRRGGRPLGALSIAILTLLLAWPELAASWSFRLTVAATAAIVLGLRHPPRFRRLLVPTAPFLATWPLVILMTGRAAPWGLPAHLAASPAMPLALAGGWLCLLLPSGWSPAVEVSRVLGRFGARWLMGVAGEVACWKGSGQLVAPVGWLWCAMVLACLGITLWRAGGRPGVWGLMAALSLAAWPLTPFARPERPSPGVLLADVGQGEALLLIGSRSSVLVDTGAAGRTRGSGALLALLRRLGCSRLDGVVLSHADRDHCGGAAAVLQALRPRWLGLSQGALDSARFAPIVREATLLGIAVRPLGRGDRFAIAGARALVLYPRGGVAGAGNAQSVTLLIKAGELRGAVTGDLGIAQEEEMLEGRPSAVVDLLVAGHHGSRTSTGRVLLERLHPKLLGISCGKGNPYGHPHRELLRRADAAGVHLWITALRGSLLLHRREGQLRIENP